MAQLTKSSQPHSNSPSYYLKELFDLEYFLVFSPFKLKWKNGAFHVKTNRFQQIVCGIFWILSIPWLFRNARKDTLNTKDFLRFCQTLINATFKIATAVSLWTQSQSFCNIVNLIENQNSNEKIATVSKICLRTLALIICTIQTIIPLSQVIVGKGSAVVANEIQITSWTFQWWWNRTVAAGYYNFYLNSNNTFVENSNNSTFDYSIGILCAIGYYTR